ncbi:acyl-CoA carboxylase epsilon subunit [Streptomyces sp. NPDC006879]|uniref:acyl-CoA carboxylase epsilon subunit n=1 Tax=Streptomyces sp. NPDC006879 TaxID=3364767 RepID=UPI0036AED54A
MATHAEPLISPDTRVPIDPLASGEPLLATGAPDATSARHLTEVRIHESQRARPRTSDHSPEPADPGPPPTSQEERGDRPPAGLLTDEGEQLSECLDAVDVRIVRGRPDAEELAALLAVLSAVAVCHDDEGALPGERRPRRAHWDRTHGGGFLPCASWRSRPDGAPPYG